MRTILYDLINERELTEDEAKWFFDSLRYARKVLHGAKFLEYKQGLLSACLCEERLPEAEVDKRLRACEAGHIVWMQAN